MVEFWRALARMGHHLVGAGACLNIFGKPGQNLPYPLSLCMTGRCLSFDNAWTAKSEYCYAQRVTKGSLQFAFHFKTGGRKLIVAALFQASFRMTIHPKSSSAIQASPA